MSTATTTPLFSKPSETQHLIYKFDDTHHQCSIELRMVPVVTEEFSPSPASQTEWLIDEDRILLQYDRIHPEEEISAKDLVKEYKRNRQKDSALFPKVKPKGMTLRNRLNSLKHSGKRYEILCEEIEKTLDEQDSEEKTNSPSPNRNKRLSSSKLSSGSIPSINNSQVEIKVHHEGETTPVVSDESVLIAHSDLFSRKCKQQRAEDGIKSIDFDVAEMGFTEEDVREANHPTLMSRFVSFASNPKVAEEFNDTQRSLNNLKSSMNREFSSLSRNQEERRNQRIEEIQKKKEQEIQDIRETLWRCKERDLEQLEMLHHIHMENELRRTESKYKNLEEDVHSFFDKEQERLSQIALQQEISRRQELEEKLHQCQEQLDDLYDQEHIVRMCILSELIQASDLKDLCIDRIGDVFNEVQSSYDFSSPALSNDTLRRILSSLPTNVLLNLQNNAEHYFEQSLIDKEIEYRKEIYANKLTKKKISELIQLQHETCHFPDTLQQELQQRREKPSHVLLNVNNCTSSVNILPNGLSVVPRDAKRYGCVHGTHSVKDGGWGKWYFEVKIDCFQYSYGSTIAVGMDPSRTSLEGDLLQGQKVPRAGITESDNADQFQGCCLQSDGILFLNGSGIYTGITFGEKDIIGICIDQDRRLIRFSVNSEPVYVNSKNEEEFIEISSKNYELFPFAYLYTSWQPTKPPPLKISFNFMGPFTHDVPHFHQPYGSGKKLQKGAIKNALQSQ
eukprot:gb/GECH01000352.1/.p1 GENE.gb/GECH01000352.1/~~gb/GECH01000352.1/.p1  ORF type:complete len:733 (+),score=171.23 gb/GECH01000352.1/:1-2199(+)